MRSTISVIGLTITLKASVTYPTGIIITSLADDTDPFDLPSITIGSSAMGANGDKLDWVTPTIIPWNIALIPGSPSDEALGILMQNNMASANKISNNDSITVIGFYQSNLQTITLSNGNLVSGMPGQSAASSGRQKTKVYGFNFGKAVWI